MLLLQVLIVIAQFAASYYFYPTLPTMLPTHWNIRGEIDGYMPKEFAVWMMPAIGLLMLVFFLIAPKFDPKKNKYELFKTEWQILKTVFLVFFAYMQGITFYAAYHPGMAFLKPMFIGLGILFILLGNYLSKIRQNYFIGIKVPWTLEDEDNWNKTHRFASFAFVIMGIIVLLEAFLFWNAAPVIFGSIVLSATLPVLYSYLLYVKKPFLMKRILIGIGVALAALIIIRLVSGEDTWICKNGKWIMHGKPSANKPTTRCIGK